MLSGFNYGKYKEFVEAAIDLGRNIAERKLHLVFGGGNRGLSKLVLEAAFVRGSQVLNIIPIALKPLGNLFDSSIEEELNVNNFYDSFIAFINHAIKNYFIPSTAKIFFICAHTANELLDLLQTYRPEPDTRTFVLQSPNNDGNSSPSKKYKLDLILRF